MSDIFWESHRSGRAGDVASAASIPAQRGAIAENKVDNLADRVDQLTLVCKAMWALVRECTDLTEEDLLKKMDELDVHDGIADGKVSRPVAPCPKCKRPLSTEHKKCLYCGFVQPVETGFDMVR